jgi:hypothetical protein
MQDRNHCIVGSYRNIYGLFWKQMLPNYEISKSCYVGEYEYE